MRGREEHTMSFVDMLMYYGRTCPQKPTINVHVGPSGAGKVSNATVYYSVTIAHVSQPDPDFTSMFVIRYLL